MKKIIIALTLVLSVNMIFIACKSEKKEDKKEQISTEENEIAKYQCPMKCEGEKTYDKKGKCAVCEMKLVKTTDLE
ncbi:heavy metal-binding domain-containing protein [Polaribacter sp. Asnod1-A03]|uniref:heavy metal-binding domain-containing protein n=1 Tax=Polaribacter sp. Asnod1-A03 TaxID=3160581 RepID=UPI003867E2BE